MTRPGPRDRWKASRATRRTPPPRPADSARSATGYATEVPPGQELRVVIATDVLSEGQNLQDGAIVVNYDLPWAIIRLGSARGPRGPHRPVSRPEFSATRSCPPTAWSACCGCAQRVRDRLRENAEVVGTDEAYFEDDEDRPIHRPLQRKVPVYWTARTTTEIDLGSYAYQIWKNATDDHPALRRQIERPPRRRLHHPHPPSFSLTVHSDSSNSRVNPRVHSFSLSLPGGGPG